MNGVFNSLTLSVPEGTPVRVHGPGLPFNAVDRGVRGTEGRPGYDVSVQGIFSAVDVITDRAISPEPPAAPAVPRSRRPPGSPALRGSREPAAGRGPSRGAGAAQGARPSPRRPPQLRPQASCSRNSPKSFTKTFRTTIASTKCAASTYQTYSGCPRSFT